MFCGLLGEKEPEMVKRRMVELGKGGGADLAPNTVDSQVKDRTAIKENTVE